MTHADGTKWTEPLADNHFRMLRRFAEELLSSEDLRKLASRWRAGRHGPSLQVKIGLQRPSPHECVVMGAARAFRAELYSEL